MKVFGLMPFEIRRITEEVSRADYGGNLKIKNLDGKMTKRGARSTVTISVNDSNEKGARRGHTGRRIAAACWHAHRDFIRALFAAGATRVQTMMADYTSANDFEVKFRDTGDKNIGSQFNPMYASEACEC